MYGTEGCSEFMAEKLPYSAIIGKHVRKGISSGVSVKDIMASIQKYSHAHLVQLLSISCMVGT